MCPDEWLSGIGISLWDSETRRRVERTQWRLARECLANGVSVVVEWGTWAAAERDRLRQSARARGARCELYVLGARVEELLRRVEARGQPDPPITHEQLSAWAAQFEQPDAAELALWDLAQCVGSTAWRSPGRWSVTL